ncbi:hypothetical protein [Campylobacter portucalensis]|nr:hypothetical protein [Campylobacter portucalensis]
MKIECDCILLQKTLELFLEDFDDKKDIIISDDMTRKGVFFIGENSPYLNLPFTKDELIIALEKFDFADLNSFEDIKKTALEDKISNIFDEFKFKILKTIREHYE